MAMMTRLGFFAGDKMPDKGDPVQAGDSDGFALFLLQPFCGGIQFR